MNEGRGRLAASIAWLAYAAVMLVVLPQADHALAVIVAAVTVLAAAVSARLVLGLGALSGLTAYTILLGIFHLGALLLEPLQIVPSTSLPHISRSEEVPFALTLVAVAVACMHAGYGFCAASGTSRKSNAAVGSSAKSDQHLESGLLAAGILGSWCGAVVALIAGYSIGLFSMTYDAWFAHRLAVDARILGVAFNLILLGTVVSSAVARGRQWLPAGLPFASAGVFFFLFGFRGPILVTAVVVACVASLRRIKLPLLAAVATATILILIAPTVGATRVGGGLEATHRVLLLGAVFEMGSSMQTLVYTLEEMRAGEPFWLGRSYLMALRGGIPNLSKQQRVPQDSPSAMSPGDWVTYSRSPWLYRQGGGLGYSAVAEPFLNFGILGVLSHFFAIGAMLSRLEAASSFSAVWRSIYACILLGLFWTVRNDIAVLVRPVLWGTALVLLGAWVVGLKPRARGG